MESRALSFDYTEFCGIFIGPAQDLREKSLDILNSPPERFGALLEHTPAINCDRLVLFSAESAPRPAKPQESFKTANTLPSVIAVARRSHNVTH